jgi:hypothetical protein
MVPRMSSGAAPFMVGAYEEIGSQEVEDPWLLGGRPLTASLRIALPMGGRHPVGLNSSASHCRDARHAAATGDPAPFASVRRTSGAQPREEAHSSSGAPPKLPGYRGRQSVSPY